MNPPRVLRPSDYENGRPDLSGMAPFIGGTLAEQRAEIERRRVTWETEAAATERARVAALKAAMAQRAAAHEATRTRPGA